MVLKQQDAGAKSKNPKSYMSLLSADILSLPADHFVFCNSGSKKARGTGPLNFTIDQPLGLSFVHHIYSVFLFHFGFVCRAETGKGKGT